VCARIFFLGTRFGFGISSEPSGVNGYVKPFLNDPPVVRRILEHLGLWQPEAMERSPPLPPEAWPVNSVLPMTYHPVPDIA